MPERGAGEAPTAAARAKLHQEAECRWLKLERDHPAMVGAIAGGRARVRCYIDHLPAAGAFTITTARAREKLAAGIPLLGDEDPLLGGDGARRFFLQLCSRTDVLEARGQHDAFRASALRGGLAIEDLLSAALGGEETAGDEAARRYGVPPDLLRALLGYTARAALIALAPVVEASGVEWPRGDHCQICGGPRSSPNCRARRGPALSAAASAAAAGASPALGVPTAAPTTPGPCTTSRRRGRPRSTASTSAIAAAATSRPSRRSPRHRPSC